MRNYLIVGSCIAAAAAWIWKEYRCIRSLPKQPIKEGGKRYVTVVTGANRGIGKCIAEVLSKAACQYTTIVVCSRNLASGEKAVDEIASRVNLKGSSVDLVTRSLDIESETSINDLMTYLSSSFGHIDVLINNAGFAYKMADLTPFPKQAADTLRINYLGTKRVTEVLLPLLEKSSRDGGGRVISVSSMAGVLKKGGEADTIRKRFMKGTVQDIDVLAKQFIKAASGGKHKGMGFSGSAYSVSKSCVTHLMRELDRTRKEMNRSTRFVAVCPGLCRTSMAGGQWKSPLSVIFWVLTWIIGQSARAGADTPAYLALCSAEEFSKYAGNFVQNRKIKAF